MVMRVFAETKKKDRKGRKTVRISPTEGERETADRQIDRQTLTLFILSFAFSFSPFPTTPPLSFTLKHLLSIMGLLDIVPAGVITGDNVRKVFAYASKHGFAIPAINCTSSSTINASLGNVLK